MTYDASDNDENPADGERVAKALARAGVASRREVERYIEDGRVAINGVVLTTPAVKVKPGDILTVDGDVVGDAEPTRLFRYHKPTGLMTSHNDPQGRPTVFAALPAELPRLISVGRLDLNSEGLLLLTNDGALSRALELPSSDWPRQYRARAFGTTDQAKLDKLKDGVTVEGVKYGPIDAKLDKAKDAPGYSGRNLWITVTLTEGKNREVRRVLESIGLKVNRLIRLAYGPFVLGTLGQGEVEEVGPRVVREQLEGLVAAANMPTGDRPQYKGGTSKAMPRREGGGMTAGRRAPTPKAPAEPKPKLEYKAGWAKPKAKANPHPPSKGPPKGPKGTPKFERGSYDRKNGPDKKHWVDGPKDGARASSGNKGRSGRVFARAEDVLPGATPRGLVKAPLREPERKGSKPEKPPHPGNALREAAAKGAERDAARRTPPREFSSSSSKSRAPVKSFSRDPDAPRKPAPGSKGAFAKGGAHRSEPAKSGPKGGGFKAGPPKDGGERGAADRAFDRSRKPSPATGGAKGPPRGPKPR